ncbi:Uric acid transporter UacT [Posidoniimonas corsicana]|uniref:Uric acid transporter UacT n=1 Tax=Posidoniimonas corsicana TaxID=1938618 RepID=A0A5C5VIF0_9BACT|nr:solute carrier family 23 protein [Posidoniimonas corsicana]TWT37803.1 Uric acid transporter UacT [Posidoniimonas corsicana]
MAESNVIHGLDDRPPLGRAVVLGLQHVLTMFGSTVAIPLLFGPAMGMSIEQIGVLISSVMLCSGLATMIQATFGSRLPIIQGVSFSFIAAFFGIIGAVSADGGSSSEMMQYIAGAVIVGAVVEMVVGFSGLMGWVRTVLSPVVVGPVIMLIGLALFQHGAPKAGTDWAISGLTMALVILFSLVLSRNNRWFKLFPIITALVIVVTLCWVLSLAGLYGGDHPSHVNLDAAKSAQWVRYQPSEIFFPWGYPKFQLGFIIAVLAGYLASMIESFGDYHACSHMAGGGDPTPRQISRGIGCEGIGCLLTGVLGGFSSTSYSENVGLIGLTKVGSRFVVQIGAGILILLGFFGKFGALAAAIPGPVVGGLYCVMFGLISAVGVQQFAKCDLRSDRNLLIGGFSLFMGLSIPTYFSSVASPEGIQAGQTLALYRPTAESFLGMLPAGMQSIVISIGSTGMAVAAIIGITLDNLIPGTKEERGLHDPGVLVPEAGDVGEGA